MRNGKNIFKQSFPSLRDYPHGEKTYNNKTYSNKAYSNKAYNNKTYNN